MAKIDISKYVDDIQEEVRKRMIYELKENGNEVTSKLTEANDELLKENQELKQELEIYKAAFDLIVNESDGCFVPEDEKGLLKCDKDLRHCSIVPGDCLKCMREYFLNKAREVGE